ncbi:S8 family serine peptidase, partial [Fibrobacterota bacterium]
GNGRAVNENGDRFVDFGIAPQADLLWVNYDYYYEVPAIEIIDSIASSLSMPCATIFAQSESFHLDITNFDPGSNNTLVYAAGNLNRENALIVKSLNHHDTVLLDSSMYIKDRDAHRLKIRTDGVSSSPIVKELQFSNSYRLLDSKYQDVPTQLSFSITTPEGNEYFFDVKGCGFDSSAGKTYETLDYYYKDGIYTDGNMVTGETVRVIKASYDNILVYKVDYQLKTLADSVGDDIRIIINSSDCIENYLLVRNAESGEQYIYPERQSLSLNTILDHFYFGYDIFNDVFSVDKHDNDQFMYIPLLVGDYIFGTKYHGTASWYSCRGPMPNGEIRPDISVPVSNMKTMVHQADRLYDHSNGTSLASAYLAGFVALLLENNPSLTHNQVREIIHGLGKEDSKTGVLPNKDYGWGKLFASADYLVSEMGLQYAATEKSRNALPGQLIISRNPSGDAVTFSCPPDMGPVDVYVFQLNGSVVTKYGNIQNQFTWHKHNRPSGVYYIKVVGKNRTYTRKVLL